MKKMEYFAKNVCSVNPKFYSLNAGMQFSSEPIIHVLSMHIYDYSGYCNL